MKQSIDPDIFAAALESSMEGITLVDAKADDYPLIYVNSGFCQMTGYSPDEVLGKNCRLLQGEGTDPRSVQKMERALQEGVACTVELLNYRKNGTAFWNRVCLSPVPGKNGEPAYFMGILSDFTEHKMIAAERMYHSSVMEQNAEEMRQSLVPISQDIQTCLKALRQSIQNSDLKADPALEMHQKQLAQHVSTLANNVSLLATMLETNSNEILQYVKKRRA